MCALGGRVETLGHLAHSDPTGIPISSNDEVLTLRVRIAAWSFLTVAGLIETVVNRHTMQDDGVNYLDMGDAIVRGDWKMALNGVWSPLYPFLQALALRIFKPRAYSQFTVIHCINFLIFLFALGCFEFLLWAAIADRESDSSATGIWPLPRWAVFGVGYAVFVWSSFNLIALQLVSPDMLMAGFLYLAVGLLLRIWVEADGFLKFILLGAVLGLGYLAKAPVFPVSVVVFALAWFCARGWRRAAPRVFAAVLAFLALSAPWFTALSRAEGQLTFGDSGRFNYVVHVNGVSAEWFFQDLGSAGGQYIHPVHKIFDAPPIYEFSKPIQATSALAYDPSYWAAGATPRVSLKRELSVIHHWLAFYLDFFFASQTALFVGFIVLAFIAGRRLLPSQITARWPVWFLGLTGLAMYAVVYAELRYIAVFFTLLWVGLFSGLKVRPGVDERRVVAAVTIAVGIGMAGPTVASVISHLHHLRSQPHTRWQVAQDLQKLGVVPGDRVARIPGHFGLAWGRLLGVTEVARIPIENAADFWCEKPETQAQAIDALRHINVAALVVEQPPPSKACGQGPEWHRVGDGTFYALMLGSTP